MILSHIIFSHGAPQLWMPFIPSTGWENIPRVTEIQFKIIFSKSIFIYIAIFCTSEMQHRVLDRDKKKKNQHSTQKAAYSLANSLLLQLDAKIPHI